MQTTLASATSVSIYLFIYDCVDSLHVFLFLLLDSQNVAQLADSPKPSRDSRRLCEKTFLERRFSLRLAHGAHSRRNPLVIITLMFSAENGLRN